MARTRRRWREGEGEGQGESDGEDTSLLESVTFRPGH